MEFLAAQHTDIGTCKGTNQDSICIMEAQTGDGNVLFAAVCDGMGGLEQGEVASAQMIGELSAWFARQLPAQLVCPDPVSEVRWCWDRMFKRVNQQLAAYGRQHRIHMGTTATALVVLPNGSYLIGHVGDTRVYRISDQHIRVVTEDQTVVVREVQQGRLTPEEAEADPRRSVLLQCIGASRIVEPVYYSGCVVPDECWLLCSDGFRHEISAQEIQEALRPESNRSEADMEHHLRTLVETDKDRMEQDNISAILIRTVKGELGHGGYWADH